VKHVEWCVVIGLRALFHKLQPTSDRRGQGES